MFKKLTVILVLLLFIFSTIPVNACNDGKGSREPVTYKSEIKVTENGGEYKVGFATIKFPKGFIQGRKLPATVRVEIYAEGGKAYIEFAPDMNNFEKDVTISACSYNGLLYDKTYRKNIQVNIRSQKFKVSHFSRYAFS